MRGQVPTKIKPGRPLHVGRCIWDTAKQSFDDPTFEKLFGMPKEQIGECDVYDRRVGADIDAMGENGGDLDPDIEHLENLGNYNKKINNPDATAAVCYEGSSPTPSCINHASYVAYHQMKAMNDSLNIRPYVNPGESPEAAYEIKEAKRKRFEHVKSNWNKQVASRRRRNMGLDTTPITYQPKTDQPIENENDVDMFDIGEEYGQASAEDLL
jgi:hypothetical protein